jgi:hypothetical protein
VVGGAVGNGWGAVGAARGRVAAGRIGREGEKGGRGRRIGTSLVDAWPPNSPLTQPPDHQPSDTQPPQEMNDNIEDRINLQKGLFEIQDANLYNK